jgi:hypothetical protein
MNDDEIKEFLAKCGITDPNITLGPPVTVTWEQLAKGVFLAVEEDRIEVIERKEF